MRKVMLLAAMLAMVLAAAAPVFAQDADTGVVGDENVVTTETEGDDTQYNAICQNIIGSIGDVTQNQSGQADAVSGDATAVSDDESVAVANSEAAAEVAQEQGVTIAQVNQCLNDFDEDGNGFVEVDETAAVVQYEGSASATEVLPETGGASLLAFGAGALLVAGGLVARRIVR